ncbi:MAG TPA: hypothetical protein VJZ03_03635 [Candidatus Bathyarchaeia archaeon]|nr:hypothetical protein [Candidatus Bathyarchaeia archaeon]
MKALLSILLGLMLVTSTLVSIAHATPIIQPAQNSGGYDTCYPHHNSNNMMMGCGCGAHSGGGNGKNHP